MRGTELGWAGLSCQEEGFSPCARSMAVGRVVVVGGWRGWGGMGGGGGIEGFRGVQRG